LIAYQNPGSVKLPSVSRLTAPPENGQQERLEWQKNLSELRIAALSRRKQRRAPWDCGQDM
jgi:hypothetical protein